MKLTTKTQIKKNQSNFNNENQMTLKDRRSWNRGCKFKKKQKSKTTCKHIFGIQKKRTELLDFHENIGSFPPCEMVSEWDSGTAVRASNSLWSPCVYHSGWVKDRNQLAFTHQTHHNVYWHHWCGSMDTDRNVYWHHWCSSTQTRQSSRQGPSANCTF